MIAPRFRKLARDLRSEKGRVLLMIAAIAVSLFAIGTVSGGYAILSRELPKNYLATRPASATLELDAGIDQKLLDEVRRRPGIADADAGEIVLARARVGDEKDSERTASPAPPSAACAFERSLHAATKSCQDFRSPLSVTDGERSGS